MSQHATPNRPASVAPPKPFDVSQLIIDRPDKQQPGQRLLLGGITLLFWGAYSFLWTPLINTLGWAFGIYAFYEHLVLMRGWQGLIDRLPLYILIVQIMGGGLILWAVLNWTRFKGKERRQAMRDVSVDDIASWRTQMPEQVNLWQRAQRMVVHYDANGKLAGVDTTPLPPNPPEPGSSGTDRPSATIHPLRANRPERS